MTKRIVSGLLVLAVVATVVAAQESPDVLLRRYLKPGLMPSAVREVQGWPSDREVLLGVASWLPQQMAADFDMQSQRPYARDGYLELPVRVRTFPQVERGMYYWVVTYVHPVKGIIYSSTYRLAEDRRTGERSFRVGGAPRTSKAPHRRT
jgi:hypothetical protein